MPRFAILFFLIRSVFFSFSSGAKSWYVSPITDQNGWRIKGNGSAENPWDLQTALSGGEGLVKPGDTIYVHDGKPYWGYYLLSFEGRIVHAAELYISGLNGKEGSPIIVKAYPGEHPVIDGGINTTPEARITTKNAGLPGQFCVLAITGTYTWFWGLEITNLSLIHISEPT